MKMVEQDKKNAENGGKVAIEEKKPKAKSKEKNEKDKIEEWKP